MSQLVERILNDLKNYLDKCRHKISRIQNEPEAEKEGSITLAREIIKTLYERKLLTENDFNDLLQKGSPYNRPSSAKKLNKAAIIRQQATGTLKTFENDIDIWHRKVCACLDNSTKTPKKTDCQTIAIEILERILSKYLTEEDLRGLQLKEPKRSASVSPNRTSPAARSRWDRYIKDQECLSTPEKQRRSKSAGVKRDNFEHDVPTPEKDDVRQTLIFSEENAEEEPCYQYRMKEERVYHSPGLHDDNLCIYLSPKARLQSIERLQEEKQELHRLYHELLKKSHRYKSERDDLRSKRLENPCINCAMSRSHMERYKAERNEALQDKKDIEAKNKRLLASECDNKVHIETLNSTIQNQKQLIMELKDRNGNLETQLEEKANATDEKIKDASSAIAHYKKTEERYKQGREQLINEKEEALGKLNKIRTEIKQCNKLNEDLKVALRKEKSENRNLRQNNGDLKANLERMEKSCADLRNEREIADLKYKDKCISQLKDELEMLQTEMQNKQSSDIHEHRLTEQKYKCQLDHAYKEKDNAKRRVKELTQEVETMYARMKDQEQIYATERGLLLMNIKNVRNGLSERETSTRDNVRLDSNEYQKSQMDRENEELVVLKREKSSMEEVISASNKKISLFQKEKESFQKQIDDLSRQLQESEARYFSSSYKRLSDIEKENVSLSSELSAALKSLVESRDDYKNLEKRLKADVERYKEEMGNLNNKNDLLQKDNNILREEIKKKEKELNRFISKESHENRNLQLENQRLEEKLDNVLAEYKKTRGIIHSEESKKNEMKERIRKLEFDLKNLENIRKDYESLQTKTDSLKVELEKIEKKFKTESSLRINSDDMTKKYKEESERLRKERSLVRNELHKVTREKTELDSQLKTEIESAQTEIDKLKKEKTELTMLLKDEAKRYQEKLNGVEHEIRMSNARSESGDRSCQQQAYELMQVKNKYEVCNNQNVILEERLADANQDIEKLKQKLKDLKSLPCQSCAEYIRNIDILTTEIQESKERCSRLYSDYMKEEKLKQELQDTAKNQHDRILDASSQIQKLLEEKRNLEIECRELTKSSNTGNEAFERKMNILEMENKDLKNKYSQRDKSLNEADKEIRQLKGLNRQLESDIVGYKQDKDTQINRIETLREEKAELEDRLRRRSPQVVTDPKNCQNCWKYRNEISDLKREVNDLRDRLSEAAGNKLRDNNPNIADLSDMNRPTSLAEKFSSLYTDEYTDAMEVIEESMDEAGCVRVMRTWLKSCYDWCERLATEQKDLLKKESIGFMAKYHGQMVDFVISDRCIIYVKEFQKKIAADSLEAVGKICHMKSVKQDNLVNNNYIIKYIKKCSELCWMMQISDPPLYLNFDVNVGENLDKNMYNVFTHSGSKIDYLVWPILYLHKTGPMLAKGVAQGM